MAEEAPASLRQADPNIYKTATRAAQLQSVKPIVAYWCEYWVLKQILAKSLHSSSPDILEYSTQLMDKMEQASHGLKSRVQATGNGDQGRIYSDQSQTKADHAGEDAILDDTAGQAYVEQFAQETLDRAQRVVRANKVTAMTANTFDAAASFFGLVSIWGPPDQENLQKIKYAKWNAARILKALKEGKDPNESNPQLDEEEEEHGQEQQEDVGANSLSLSPGPAPTVVAPRPVTIEDEPDDGDVLHLPDVPSTGAGAGAGAAQTADSPPTIPSVPSFDPAGPIGSDSAPVIPSPPVPTPSPPVVQPTFLPPSPPQPDPEPYYHHQQPQNNAPRTGYSATPPSAVTGFPPSSAPQPSWSSRAAPPSLPRARQPAPTAPPPPQAVDEAAMASAQKHAKWAISALNFEDVTTAVRELRKALEDLGSF